jgi:LPXTG-motif cell wall-anchored protein
MVLLGLFAPVAAQAADSSPTIGGFSARALGEGDEITPETYFKLKLGPGDSYQGRLLVISSAKEDARLRVYSVDGLTGNTSGTVYANIDDPRKDAATWITPRKEVLRLPGKGEKKVGFDVKVPADATPGDHVGAIALQLADQKKTKGQFAITQITRVAIAVQITVEGPADAALAPTGLALKALPGTQIPSVTIDLANTGQLLCRPSLAVQLSKDGTVLGTVTRQLDTVLPGKTIPYPLSWPKPLTAGKYNAKASTTGCGAPKEFVSDVELKGNLAGSAQQPGTIIEPNTGGGGIPWWALVAAVVAALFGGFLLARRKPKRDDDAAPANP